MFIKEFADNKSLLRHHQQPHTQFSAHTVLGFTFALWGEVG